MCQVACVTYFLNIVLRYWVQLSYRHWYNTKFILLTPITFWLTSSCLDFTFLTAICISPINHSVSIDSLRPKQRTLKPHLLSPAILLRAIQWSSCASAELARVLLYWSGTTATIKVCLCTAVLSFPVKSGNLELSWRAMTEIEKAQPTKTDGATIFDSSESSSVVKCKM